MKSKYQQIRHEDQRSLKVKWNESSIKTIYRNDDGFFHCVPLCAMKYKWPESFQKHCRSCSHFSISSNTEEANRNMTIASSIIEVDVTAPSTLQAPVITMNTESATTITCQTDHPCHSILIGGSEIPLRYNPRFNCIICEICKYVLPNVNAIKFHFTKYHKNQLNSFSFIGFHEWMEENCLELLNIDLTSKLLTEHLSQDNNGMDGIPLHEGFQCFICDHASMALSSMRKHIYLHHKPNAPFKHVQVQSL